MHWLRQKSSKGDVNEGWPKLSMPEKNEKAKNPNQPERLGLHARRCALLSRHTKRSQGSAMRLQNRVHR